MKDVSDQIESEDQLDKARRQGEEKQEEDESKQPDVKSEDNAIERSGDFEGKMQDLEDAGQNMLLWRDLIWQEINIDFITLASS